MAKIRIKFGQRVVIRRTKIGRARQSVPADKRSEGAAPSPQVSHSNALAPQLFRSPYRPRRDRGGIEIFDLGRNRDGSTWNAALLYPVTLLTYSFTNSFVFQRNASIDPGWPAFTAGLLSRFAAGEYKKIERLNSWMLDFDLVSFEDSGEHDFYYLAEAGERRILRDHQFSTPNDPNNSAIPALTPETVEWKSDGKLMVALKKHLRVNSGPYFSQFETNNPVWFKVTDQPVFSAPAVVPDVSGRGAKIYLVPQMIPVVYNQTLEQFGGLQPRYIKHAFEGYQLFPREHLNNAALVTGTRETSVQTGGNQITDYTWSNLPFSYNYTNPASLAALRLVISQAVARGAAAGGRALLKYDSGVSNPVGSFFNLSEWDSLTPPGGYSANIQKSAVYGTLASSNLYLRRMGGITSETTTPLIKVVNPWGSPAAGSPVEDFSQPSVGSLLAILKVSGNTYYVWQNNRTFVYPSLPEYNSLEGWRTYRKFGLSLSNRGDLPNGVWYLM